MKKNFLREKNIHTGYPGRFPPGVVLSFATPPDSHPCTASGNNIDGFILTEWRQENARTKIRRA